MNLGQLFSEFGLGNIKILCKKKEFYDEIRMKNAAYFIQLRNSHCALIY